MKNKKNRQARSQFYISVFLFKDGKLVEKYSSHQNARVLRFLQMRNLAELKIDYSFCHVSYIPRKNVFNAFKFRDLEDYKKSISECTEPELLRFIAEGNW